MIVNETINVTMNTTLQESQGNAVISFFSLIQHRIIKLITAPSRYPEMLWMAIPLIFTLFVMQLYFGRYIKEELGWNTAVGNSMVLIFISIDLFRYIYNHFEPHHWIVYFYQYKKSLIALLILVQGMILWKENFFHKWPKKIAFFISSPICVNLIAYVALASVYSNVPFDGITLIAALVIFFILAGIFHLIHKVEYVPEQT